MATPVSTAPVIEPTLDSDLGWALGTVFRAYLKSVDAVVADLPGGPRGYQVLSAAGRDLPTSQQALGQRVGVDRSVMTYLVDDLVEAGLVERQPDPADRRARRIVLTKAGTKRLCALDGRLKQVEDHVLGVLPVEDRATFVALLRQVAGRANDLDPAKSACGIVEDVAKLSGE